MVAALYDAVVGDAPVIARGAADARARRDSGADAKGEPAGTEAGGASRASRSEAHLCQSAQTRVGQSQKIARDSDPLGRDARSEMLRFFLLHQNVQ
jgi:hypothetical protein